MEGNSWKLFRDYITGRLPYVSVEGPMYSHILPVRSGVPPGEYYQAFILYINDLPDAHSQGSSQRGKEEGGGGAPLF